MPTWSIFVLSTLLTEQSVWLVIYTTMLLYPELISSKLVGTVVKCALTTPCAYCCHTCVAPNVWDERLL